MAGRELTNDAASWYTNPQTEAFSEMLGIPNKINPMPAGFKEAQAAAKVLEDARLAEQVVRDKEALAEMRKEALRMLEETPVEEKEVVMAEVVVFEEAGVL